MVLSAQFTTPSYAAKLSPDNKVGRFMAISPDTLEPIATSSVEEGLDFACSVLSSAVAQEGVARPEKAVSLLNQLARYIELRYVGETLLALEYLAGIGRSCDPMAFRSSQFWQQLKWVASQMNLTREEPQRLELKGE